MAPSEAERDLLFKQFGRAFFKQDMDALYEVVTENFTYSILVNDESRVMRSRDEVAAFFKERNGTQKDVRFEDVVFHHAQEATFMTYRVTGTDLATNARFEKIGVERIYIRQRTNCRKGRLQQARLNAFRSVVGWFI